MVMCLVFSKPTHLKELPFGTNFHFTQIFSMEISLTKNETFVKKLVGVRSKFESCTDSIGERGK